MKKKFKTVLVALLIIPCFGLFMAGCGSNQPPTTQPSSSQKVQPPSASQLLAFGIIGGFTPHVNGTLQRYTFMHSGFEMNWYNTDREISLVRITTWLTAQGFIYSTTKLWGWVDFHKSNSQGISVAVLLYPPDVSNTIMLHFNCCNDITINWKHTY